MPPRPAALATAFLASLFLALPAAAQDAIAVGHADVDRLMGRWYEIARLPVDRERDCAADAVAEFELRSEYAFRMTLTCRTTDDRQQQVVGVARLRDRASHAKFDVRFAPLAFAWLPFVWDDWWVLDVSPQYDALLAGNPHHDALWVYARTPEIDDATYRAIVARAGTQGYDVTRMVRTPQARHAASN